VVEFRLENPELGLEILLGRWEVSFSISG